MCFHKSFIRNIRRLIFLTNSIFFCVQRNAQYYTFNFQLCTISFEILGTDGRHFAITSSNLTGRSIKKQFVLKLPEIACNQDNRFDQSDSSLVIYALKTKHFGTQFINWRLLSSICRVDRLTLH